MPAGRRPGVAPPFWSLVLRALREMSGVTQDGWAARLGFGRATIQRWERGETAPGVEAEAALESLCRQRGLFRTYDQGPLRGVTVTPEFLRDLLAEARLGAGAPAAGSAPGRGDVQPEQGAEAAEEGDAAASVAVGRLVARAARLLSRASVPGPAPAAPAAPRPFPTNLPAMLSSFVGREREVAAVRRRLATTRLLTLTGPGGIGKTRLALEAAGALNGFADGVWLVELAPVTEPEIVPQAVAQALGVREERARPLRESLIEHLEAKRLLLVLDNCEHVQAACAELAERLLRACPSVRLLATSRVPLRVTGETRYPVPSLAVPASEALTPDRLLGCEAVALFVERARAALRTFALTEANARAVADICRRLEGMPLALELAAARTRVLTVEQIAARLDDRFRLLAGGSPAAPSRHQTLQATLDWSYDLLGEPERLLFDRLAVFAGGFTLAAGEAVCAGDGVEPYDVLDLLTSLLDKSLVVRDGEEEGDEARYHLLETVRQYVWVNLKITGELEALRHRHGDWYLALAEQAEPELKGPLQTAWLDRLEREHDNLRAALAWSEADAAAETGLRLIGALWRFWVIRGYITEGRARAKRVLDAGAAAAPGLRAKALNAAGILARHGGDMDQAWTLLHEGLALARIAGDTRRVTLALSDLANVAHGRGDIEQAQVLGEESLALRRELGDTWGIASSLNNLGMYATSQGDYELAEQRLRESQQLFQELGDWEPVAGTSINLGEVARRRGALQEARAHYVQSLSLLREMGNRQVVAEVLGLIALVAAAEGRTTPAARLLAATEALREAIGKELTPIDRAEHDQAVASLQAALGAEAFAAAWAAGRAMSPEQATAEALKPIGV
jgi:predicted ATPase/transcriptional regulator with XRE-family HTH domain